MLAELHASPRACGPLAYALRTQLAHGHALAARVDDAIQDVRQYPANTLCPSVLEPLMLPPDPDKVSFKVVHLS